MRRAEPTLVRPAVFRWLHRLVHAISWLMSKITRLTGGGPPSEVNGQRSPEGETPEDSVGQELRAARLRRGDELSRVSHALRIGKAYLEAIESDLPEKLPGRAY